jgi:hypothetical protein
MTFKIAFIALMFSSFASAATFHVTMSKSCRYPNGNFQVSMGSTTVDLVPGSESAVQELDGLATSAAVSNESINFTVSGSVLSDETIPFPRRGQMRLLKVLVHHTQR